MYIIVSIWIPDRYIIKVRECTNCQNRAILVVLLYLIKVDHKKLNPRRSYYYHLILPNRNLSMLLVVENLP